MMQTMINRKMKTDKTVSLPSKEKNPQKIKEPTESEILETKESNSIELDKERTASIFGQSEEEICKEFRAFKASKIFKKFDIDLTGICDAENLNAKLDEIIKFGFGSVVVNSKQIKSAKQKLGGKVQVYAAVCYPFGEECYGVKKYACKIAFSEGADGVYVPVGVYDVLRGKMEQIRREFAKIVKRNKKRKVFAIVEVGKLDLSSCERLLKALSKVKLAGIVSGTGGNYGEKISGVGDLHSLSGGKTPIIAYSKSEKSREVISLFSVADRIFLKNATNIAVDLKSNLEC